MITLAIDGSTYTGSVAVLRDGAILAEDAVPMRGEHEERLMPGVEAMLRRLELSAADLDRVVCGAGPGSFTSLRIAVSIAKGIAYGANRPLYAVSSLALLVAAASRAPGTYVAALDALRNEWYAAVFTIGDGGDVIASEPHRILTPRELMLLVLDRRATLVGATTTEEHLSGDITSVVGSPDEQPRAAGVRRLERLLADGAVDVASWEPGYGRLAEAQVRWEQAHGRVLDAG